MKRTKYGKHKLPDAIYRRKSSGNYTQIPNSFIRDPNIGAVAKTILSILLSNKDGEWTTHLTELKSKMKEGRDVIKQGMAELTDNGYVLQVRYREKNSKILRGSFWAITDEAFHFEYHKNVKILEKINYEVIERKPTFFHHKPEIPGGGKSTPNNTIIIKEINGGVETPPSNKELIALYQANKDTICPNGMTFIAGYNVFDKRSKCRSCLITDTCKKLNEGNITLNGYLFSLKDPIEDDGRLYFRCNDGKYRNKGGEIYIP